VLTLSSIDAMPNTKSGFTADIEPHRADIRNIARLGKLRSAWYGKIES
jgi:hypothetical protein